MTHLWMRAEQRDNEQRAPLTPEGAARLIAAGLRLTVEDSPARILPTDAYRQAGAGIAAPGSWVQAPGDAIILGLKELPEDDTPLHHTHIMFGHAYKGQGAGARLLARFAAGGGRLLDLEYLTDAGGRRVAAFGYWAGFAGAAVTVLAWSAGRNGTIAGPVAAWPDADAMIADAARALGPTRPTALVIGALGRVGRGAADLCKGLDIPVTGWDMAETANGGPFPQILDHDLFFNCILARPGTPVFVGPEALAAPRRLAAIGDIACDPDSDYNPIPLYDRATDWAAPVTRVHADPVLDIMAIDNLPSLLPRESTLDFADQLLPHLLTLSDDPDGVWDRAARLFADHVRR
ncbi:MAG: saccharopine dehydrogenase (NAD+, L-lysine forming) [Rhodobacteraceae bacterium HLUCCA08]|nr:MAG: saccharopine dehydrogenase (NAD+, L-lysine forming) [Rhodobacteraceae bacterium HLUCCA08]